MKTLIFLLFAGMISAQKLQPIVGIHWTGGFSYNMEHELPSAELGILYSPKKSVIKNVQISGAFYYDFISERVNNQHTFYVVKVQAAKEFTEFWNFTGYVGYVNAFDRQLMSHYAGDFKTNLAYGIGIQTADDHIIGELLYESLAGYPQISVGVTYKFKSLIKKR